MSNNEKSDGTHHEHHEKAAEQHKHAAKKTENVRGKLPKDWTGKPTSSDQGIDA
jgi:hypothetical protein